MNHAILPIAGLLILSFIVMMIIFFVYLVPINYHNIKVINKSDRDLIVIFGALSANGAVLNLPNRTLKKDESFTYQATAGVTVYVQAANAGDKIGFINPFTTGIIVFAGQTYSGPTQITNGREIIHGLANNANFEDQYGVSMQQGYNTPLVIAPYQNYQSGTGFYNCGSVIWAGEIHKDRCPDDLQLNTPNYQACMTPCFQDPTSSDKCCTLGCEHCPNNTWITDYTIFHDACPACMITNCDKPNFFCSSNAFLSGYQVTFVI